MVMLRRPPNPVLLVQGALRRNRRDIVNPLGGPGFQYSTGDPNTFPIENAYSESLVFNGAPVNLPAMGLAASSVISEAAGKPAGYQNNDTFLVQKLPGATSGLSLNANPKRISLTVQNQDAALDLYFALGTQAVSGGGFVGVLLQPGEGYVFDNGCVPSDAVYFAWDGGTGVGVVMEGTRA
jgi:hypothetical protein